MIEKVKLCMGCGACKNKCSNNAIEMIEDESGFLKPCVDSKKCINCGECLKVCPICTTSKTGLESTKYYAASAYENVSRLSSSGGLFSVLAANIINQGGVVWGVAWSEDFQCEYRRIDRLSDIDLIRRAKYLQSNTGTSYRAVKEDVKKRKVLYVGCPCQIAGLKNYIGDEKNLLTVDLLCNHVPPMFMFKRYIKDTYQERTVEKFEFRDKKFGWRADGEQIKFVQGDNKHIVGNECSYMEAFLNGLTMNDTCANCRYNSDKREGDISIGDFWGIEKHIKNLEGEQGVSAVLINSAKGKEIFETIEKQLKFCYEAKKEWLNTNRIGFKLRPHNARDRFFELIKIKKFPDAVYQALNNKYDIAIMTLMSEPNYGAHLTYYALYNYLKDCGYSVIMLQHPLDSKLKPHETPMLFSVNPYPKYDIAKLYNTKEELIETNCLADCFMIGSDQVWNYEPFVSFGKVHTLDFINSDKKKIAYATSFAHDSWKGNRESEIEFQRELKKFNAISVRETSGVKILKDTFQVDGTMCMDPIFLCDFSHYEELAQNSKIKFREHHIASYMMGITEEQKKILTYIKEQKKLPISLFPYPNDVYDDKKYDLFCIRDASEEDWIKGFMSCDFTITNSYHALCISILFQKNFIVIARPEWGMARFESLLRLLGLEERLIFNLDDLKNKRDILFRKIDYSKINLILRNEVEKSKSWLKEALLKEGRKKTQYDDLSDQLNNMKFKNYNMNNEMQKDICEMEKNIRLLMKKNESLEKQLNDMKSTYAYRLYKIITNKIKK